MRNVYFIVIVGLIFFYRELFFVINGVDNVFRIWIFDGFIGEGWFLRFRMGYSVFFINIRYYG